MLSEGHKTSPREEPDTRPVVWGYGSGLIFFCLFLRGGSLLLGLPSSAGPLAGWIPLPWQPALPGKVPLCPVRGTCTPLPSLGPRGAGGHAASQLWAAQEASSCLPSASAHEPSQREGTTGAPLLRSPVPAAPAQTCRKREARFWGVRGVDACSTTRSLAMALGFGRKVPACG